MQYSWKQLRRSLSTMVNYDKLSREDLVKRLQSFERQSTALTEPLVKDESASSPASSAKPVKIAKTFSFASHPTRHIALLLSYHGWPYSGLAIQSALSPTPLPTVEGELLVALEKAKLIEEGKGWEGCSFSRCGRTDRGVSGEGQVVDLWVRSSRKEGDGGPSLEGVGWRPATEPKEETKLEQPVEGKAASKSAVKPRTPTEFSYPRLLNSLLPDSIRILAWSPLPTVSPPPIATSSTRGALPPPAPEPFDARFSCTSRHYKYAFHPRPTPSAPPLDLELMREAAKLLIGEHDFRNFCKLDGSKQIENHSRGVVNAWIEELGVKEGEGENTLCVFNLVGTAFLWHQVRHIVAILLLIGSKLEPISIIPTLLSTGVHSPLPTVQVPEQLFTSKPVYHMASPIPLTLHSCGYEERVGLDWRYGPYDGPHMALKADERQALQRSAMEGFDALHRSLESQRQDAEIRAWQVGAAGRKVNAIFPDYVAPVGAHEQGAVIPIGGGELVTVKKYQPVLTRKRGDTPEVVNQRWRDGQGSRRAAKRESGTEMEE